MGKCIGPPDKKSVLGQPMTSSAYLYKADHWGPPQPLCTLSPLFMCSNVFHPTAQKREQDGSRATERTQIFLQGELITPSRKPVAHPSPNTNPRPGFKGEGGTGN